MGETGRGGCETYTERRSERRTSCRIAVDVSLNGRATEKESGSGVAFFLPELLPVAAFFGGIERRC